MSSGTPTATYICGSGNNTMVGGETTTTGGGAPMLTLTLTWAWAEVARNPADNMKPRNTPDLVVITYSFCVELLCQTTLGNRPANSARIEKQEVTSYRFAGI